jgi:hypothetical protein
VFLDDRGRVVDFQELLFTDEAEAVRQVARRRHEVAVELWESGRLIRRFDPRPGG